MAELLTLTKEQRKAILLDYADFMHRLAALEEANPMASGSGGGVKGRKPGCKCADCQKKMGGGKRAGSP